MLKRGYKLIISVVLVATLFVGFSVFASADVVGGAGLLGSALGSLGVDLLAGGSATFASIAPWLNGEYSIRGVLTGVADGFIKVNDDSVFIDGVEYQSIFLDPSMAVELHTQAFDFVSQKAITSNSSGILAMGAGYAAGVPVYITSGNSFRSQEFVTSGYGTFPLGDITITIENWTASYPYHYKAVYGQSTINDPTSRTGTFTSYLDGDIRDTYCSLNRRSELDTRSTTLYNSVVSDPFNYSYVSGTIDVTPLPSNYGFSAYIPHADLSSAGIVAGSYYNDNDLAIVNQLIDLLDRAYSNAQIKDAEFAEESQPVPPVPTTTIADTAYSDLHAEMVDIKNNQAHANTALDNIDTGIDVIGRAVDNIDDTVTDIEGYIQTGTSDIVDSVDTAGQAVVDGLSDVEGAVDTAGQSVVNEVGRLRTIFDTIGQSVITLLQGIRTAIGTGVQSIVDAVDSATDAIENLAENILEDIETAPINVFSTALDVIKLVFAPVIATLKACIGLWHYVVEWVQATAPVFSSFFGLMNGTSYNMVLPIYASLAGPIVIAVYKRFGK